MKDATVLMMVSLAVLVLSPAVAPAYPLSVDDAVTLTNDNGTTGVGQVKAVVNSSFIFTTFRLEDGPGNLTSTYRVKAISNMLGSGNKILDERVAFLYYHYMAGDLDKLTNGQFSYDKGAADLQRAIWFIDRAGGGDDNYLVKLADSATSGDNPLWDGLGPVRVVQLDDYGQGSQSAQGGTSVLVLIPEPETLLLLLAGLLGLGIAAALHRSRRLKGIDS